MNNLQALYDAGYVGGYHQEPGLRIFRLLKKIHIAPNDVVLDIGCGNGLLFEAIGDKVSRYVGIDFSHAFISICQNKYKDNSKAEFKCVDAVDFCNERQGAFNKVFLFDVTEHIPDKELLDILKAAYFSLVPSGHLYIHTPNGGYFLEKLKSWGLLKQITGHVAVRSPGEYRKIISEAGFRSVDITFLSHYKFILRILHWLSFIPVVGNYFRARLFISCGV